MTENTSYIDDSRLISTYTRHNAPDHAQRAWIRQVSWSPTGKLIASIGSHGGGAVHVWDPFNGELKFTYRKQRGYHDWTYNGRKALVSLGGFCWSPTGDRIASSSWNGTVHVFETRRALTGRKPELIYKRSDREGTGAVVWSPDGRLVACVGLSSFYTAVDVWDAKTGVTRWAWEGPQGAVGDTALAWSPDGHQLAMSNYGDVRIFEANTGRQSSTIVSMDSLQPRTRYWSYVKDISWSPDGKYIAIAGSFIQIRDARSAALVLRYPRTEEDGYLNTVSWSPIGDRLAFSTARGVHVWDALNMVELSGYPHRVAFSLDWSPDGKYLASGGNDCLIHVWRQ